MPEEIMPGLYRLEIPLPNNPLKMLNSYVIRDGRRSLVIDTGFNRAECLTAMRPGLDDLAVDPDKTDFFITHLHADHSGLAYTLAGAGATFYASSLDATVINSFAASQSHWESLGRAACRHGFPAAEANKAVERHPGRKYGPAGQVTFTPVRDGDNIRAGGYNFVCVATPGHTAGHMCLYEPERHILIAGDHVLGDITPNISQWSADDNCLSDYLASLEKVAALDIAIVLPGHRRVFNDCRGRISQLKEHHRQRAEEALAILAAGPLTAYQVASRMHWDLTYSSWEEFPPPQQWFATGEAVAHLRYLELTGKIGRDERDGLIYYRIPPHSV